MNAGSSMKSSRTCGGSDATTSAACTCSDASRLNGRSQRSMSGHMCISNDTPPAGKENEDGRSRMEDGERTSFAILYPLSSILVFAPDRAGLRQRNGLPRLHAVRVDLGVGGGDLLPLVAVAVAR